jgi:hypothetical protein
MAPPDNSKKSSKKSYKKRGNSGYVPEASATSGAEPEVINIVTELNPHDVLFGRTADTVNYQGNMRYREMVRRRKADYMGTGRHRVKDEIARQIIAIIETSGGRFLRRAEEASDETSTEEKEERATHWIVVSEAEALQKVKQALREQATLSDATARPDGAAAAVDNMPIQPPPVGSSDANGVTRSSNAISSSNPNVAPSAMLPTSLPLNALGVTNVGSSTAVTFQDPLSMLGQVNRQEIELWRQQQESEANRRFLLQLQVRQQTEQQLRVIQQQEIQRQLQQQQLDQQLLALRSAAVAFPGNSLPPYSLAANNPSLLTTTPVVDPNWLLRASVLSVARERQDQQQQQLSASLWNGSLVGAQLGSMPLASNAEQLRLALLLQQQQMGGMNAMDNSTASLASLSPSGNQLSSSVAQSAPSQISAATTINSSPSAFLEQMRLPNEAAPNASNSFSLLHDNSFATPTRTKQREAINLQSNDAGLPPAGQNTEDSSESRSETTMPATTRDGDSKPRARDPENSSGSSSSSSTTSSKTTPSASDPLPSKRSRRKRQRRPS